MVIVIALPFLLAFFVLRTAFRWHGKWRLIATIPLILLTLVILNIIININSHNLFPFEILFWSIVGFIVYGIINTIHDKTVEQPTKQIL